MQVDVSFAVNSMNLVEHFGIAVFQVFLSLESDVAEKIGPDDTSLMNQGLSALSEFRPERPTALEMAFEIAKRMLVAYGSDFKAVHVKYMNGLALSISAEAFASEWLRRGGHGDYLINPLERVIHLFSATKED